MNRQGEENAILNGSHIEAAGDKSNHVPPKVRVCGLAPKLFWTLMVLCASLIAIGLGVGLGVGLAKSKNNAKACQEISVQTKTVTSFVTASSAGVPAPEIAQATTTATTTATTPAVPTVTLVLGTIANNPGADNHLIIAEPIPGVTCTSDNLQNVTFSGYKINGAYLQYLITCGTNWGETYNGDYVHDLQVIANVTSFSNCLNECSLYSVRLPDSQSANSPSGYANFCSGALWRDDNACYLKGNITKGATGFPDSSIQGAAVLVPPSDGSWGVSGYYCGTQYGSGYSCT